MVGGGFLNMMPPPQPTGGAYARYERGDPILKRPLDKQVMVFLVVSALHLCHYRLE